MQTANELLNRILGVLGEMNARQTKGSEKAKTGGGDKPSGVKDVIGISNALSSFAKIKPKTTKRFIDL